MRILSILVALAFCTCIAAHAANLDWLSEHRTSSNQRSVPTTFHQFGKQHSYTVDLKATSLFSNILVEGDRAYFGTACFHKDERNVLMSYDIAQRKPAWAMQLKDSLFSSPLIVGDKIVFVTRERLLVLDKQNGALLFQMPTNTNKPGRLAAPVNIAGRVLFTDAEGTLTLLDLSTYKPIWTTTLESGLSGTPALVGDEIIAAAAFGIVSRIDAATGKVKTKFGTNPILSAPYIADGQLFLALYPGRLYSFDPQGKILWGRGLAEGMSNLPVAGEDHLYYLTPGYGAWAFGLHSGEIAWKTYEQSKHTMFLASPTLLDNAIVAPLMVKELVVLDRETGKELASINHGGLSYSSPTVTDKYMVFDTTVMREADEIAAEHRYSFATIYIAEYK